MPDWERAYIQKTCWTQKAASYSLTERIFLYKTKEYFLHSDKFFSYILTVPLSNLDIMYNAIFIYYNSTIILFHHTLFIRGGNGLKQLPDITVTMVDPVKE